MYNPNQPVNVLRTDGGRIEKCTITFPATAAATQGDYVNINARGKDFACWLNIDVGYPGVKEVTTVTFPATADATQADYLYILNQSGAKFAIWLDIDADGTAPTGALYVAATKIKAGIATGDAAIAVAAKVVAAIGTSLTGITIEDNLDGTVTFTQNNYGATTDAAPKNADDSGVGSITITVDTDGIDPVVPTGAIYTAADYQVRADIATGDLAPAVATSAYNALMALEDFKLAVDVKNNLDGTITLWQNVDGNVTDPSVKSYDDAGAGSITKTVNTQGINIPNVQAGSPEDFTNEPSIVS